MADGRFIQREEQFETEENLIPERITDLSESDESETEDDDESDEYDDEEDRAMAILPVTFDFRNQFEEDDSDDSEDYYSSGDSDDDDDDAVAKLITPGFVWSWSDGSVVTENSKEVNETKEEGNRCETDGLICSICFEAWTNGGQHQISCLPCGHIYGLSCIHKWLVRSSGKCPQCNQVCTLMDVRVLYASRLCVADEELQKKVRLLESKCAYLEWKRALMHDELIRILGRLLRLT